MAATLGPSLALFTTPICITDYYELWECYGLEASSPGGIRTPLDRSSSTVGMSVSSIVASTSSLIFGRVTIRLACLLIVISNKLRAVRALPNDSSRARLRSLNNSRSLCSAFAVNLKDALAQKPLKISTDQTCWWMFCFRGAQAVSQRLQWMSHLGQWGIQTTASSN